MTLNPPISFSFPLTKDDDHDQYHDKLFMISSSSTSSSINTHDHGDDPREAHFTDHGDQYNKVRKPISKGGSWDNPQSSSSFSPRKNEGSYEQDLQAQSKNFSNVESATWMSSKVRLIHKMISSSDNIDDGDHDKSTTTMKIKLQSRQEEHSTDPQQFHNNNNTGITRACSDCNTTTTPLWRTGPRGPKSLCNACGIRQRKARRAMAEAANGAVSGVEAAAVPAGVRGTNKEKKGRGGLAGTMKKQQCKQEDHNNKPFLKDFDLRLSYDDPTFSRVFPKDEEEAAFLLMELSCGLVHT